MGNLFKVVYLNGEKHAIIWLRNMGVLSGNDAKLERVQRAAIRSFLGVHSRFPLLGLELEAGLTPLRWEARRRAIRYWVKVHRLRENRLL